MVRALIALVRLTHTQPTFEAAAACLVGGGVYLGFGLPATLITLGALAFLKSLDIQMSKAEPEDR